MIEEVIFALLAAEPTITNLTGDRITPLTRPQQVAEVNQYPSVVYQVLGEDDGKGNQTMLTVTDLRKQMLIVNCLAADYEGSVVLADAVYNFLNGRYGGKISGLMFRTMADDFIEPISQDEEGAYNRLLEFTLWSHP